jgi:hypothetical protein
LPFPILFNNNKKKKNKERKKEEDYLVTELPKRKEIQHGSHKIIFKKIVELDIKNK